VGGVAGGIEKLWQREARFVPHILTVSAAFAPISPADRFRAFILGLHGLALLVVFPLGPQETRLWHPGVNGVAAVAAAYPLAACLGGLLARRAHSLPARPVALVGLALLGTLPCALSFDHPTLLLARLWAGLLAGISHVAIQRLSLIHI
jgi:hypothetical protein